MPRNHETVPSDLQLVQLAHKMRMPVDDKVLTYVVKDTITKMPAIPAIFATAKQLPTMDLLLSKMKTAGLEDSTALKVHKAVSVDKEDSIGGTNSVLSVPGMGAVGGFNALGGLSTHSTHTNHSHGSSSSSHAAPARVSVDCGVMINKPAVLIGRTSYQLK